MDINSALRRRKLGLPGRIEIDFAVNRMIRLKEVIRLESLTESDEEEIDSKASGPLACTKLNNNIIAVANEDGFINLLDTSKMKDIAHWEAHKNAIFDIKSSDDKTSLFTASGDTNIVHWDVETKKAKQVLSPHYSSIKSISVYDAHILASGSRDGCIKIHDLRLKEPTFAIIRDAHRNRLISKARKPTVKTDPASVVTNVTFEPHFPRLYSTGANDATIKLWDLRRTTTTNKPRRSLDGHLMINQPHTEVHHPSRGIHCGYSYLLFSNGKIYAACSDNKIYCYDNFGSSDTPTKFTGYHYDTYLKMAIMDDRFLLSGSKGGGATIWSLGTKRSSSMYMPDTTKHSIGQLMPDNNDTNDTNVIETDWESLAIYTFRDDRVVCKWTLQHVLESERKKLVQEEGVASTYDDVTMQMSDIIDINVLRLNHRVSNNVDNHTPA